MFSQSLIIIELDTTTTTLFFSGSAPVPLPVAAAHDGPALHGDPRVSRRKREPERLVERDQDRRPRDPRPAQELTGPQAQLNKGAEVGEQQHVVVTQPLLARREHGGGRVPRVPLGPGPDHHDRVRSRLGQPRGGSVRATADQPKRKPGEISSCPKILSGVPNLELTIVLGYWRAPPNGT